MKFFFNLLIIALTVNTASADVTYSTHKSDGSVIAVFTQMQGPGSFGSAWKDPSGILWSQSQGMYDNSPITPDKQVVATPGDWTHYGYGYVTDSQATEACTRIGGILPTIWDFNTLSLFFEMEGLIGYNQQLSAQGTKDWVALFPDMIVSRYFFNLNTFWTSTVSLTAANTLSSLLRPFILNSGLGNTSLLQDPNYRQQQMSVRCRTP